MANNRMWLCHADGRKVLLAKDLGEVWVPWEQLSDKLENVFKQDLGYRASTGWFILYENWTEDDHPLQPTAVET